jgi:hypothetical protein
MAYQFGEAAKGGGLSPIWELPPVPNPQGFHVQADAAFTGSITLNISGTVEGSGIPGNITVPINGSAQRFEFSGGPSNLNGSARFQFTNSQTGVSPVVITIRLDGPDETNTGPVIAQFTALG